jgi:hypothetical protein
MNYKVIKEFKGAPDGKRTLTFLVDQEILRTDLGDDLAEVAQREGWIEEIEEIKQRNPRAPNKKKKTSEPEKDDASASEGELDLENETPE